VNLTSVYLEEDKPEYKMGSINSPNTEKTIVQEKPTGGAEFLERTSSTDVSDTMGAGFDGLNDDECKALEKRRMHLTLSSPSFG
jgi:hypothetical protein